MLFRSAMKKTSLSKAARKFSSPMKLAVVSPTEASLNAR